jgi:peptide/nickel transport system substrate-binding protein
MSEQNYWQRTQRRLTRRSLFGVAAGTAGAAALLACGNRQASSGQASGTSSSSGSQTPKPGGQFNTSQITTPPTLDQQRNTSGNIGNIVGAVQSRLLAFKTGTDGATTTENHEVEPDLALSVDSPDAVVWTVKLRPDAKFHNVAPVNGHPVTSEDVKTTFVRALGKENPGRGALDMVDDAQIQTPAPDTVVFTLKYPFAQFKAKLASVAYSSIFPREIATGSYDSAKMPIGSGPFVFDSNQPDVAYTLKKNPAWHFQGRPYVDSIRWAIIPDTGQQQAQFTGGHLDVVGMVESAPVTPNDLTQYKKDNPKAQVVRSDPSSPQLLYFQLGDPASAFQDIRLRRAFSMAIDRDALNKAVWNNDAEPQFHVHLTQGKWALHQNELPSDTAQYYKYDPANAKKLLDASGFTDRQFKLLYIVPFQGADYVKVSLALANMLSQAGIKIQPVQVDYNKDYFGTNGVGIRFGVYDKDSVVCTGISALDNVDDFLWNYYSTKATQGISRLKDPTIDDMIAKARTLVDENAAVKAYKDVQIYIADKMYTVAGLPEPNSYILVNPRVQNYQFSVNHGYGTETFAKLWLNAQ